MIDANGIKYINLIFENCDLIKIDGKHIGYFMLDDIRKSLQIFGCNAFGEASTAQFFAIEIHKDANRPHDGFGTNEKETIFERIERCPDITSVEVEELNGRHTEYFVLWYRGSEYKNAYQSTVTGKNGNLYLVIDKNDTASKLFNDFKDTGWPWLRDDWGESDG